MELNTVISEHLARGEKGALATIVEKIGSAPRDEGARMFVTAQGKIFGTVGGGSVEAQACLESRKVIETGCCRMLRFRMDGKNAAEEDMICGGNVSIFIEPVEEKHKEVYDTVSNAIRFGAKGFVITQYSASGFSKSFLLDTGAVVGDALDEETRALICSAGERLIISDGLIVAPILTSSRLYIFGAGHVSQYISRIAAMVDFDVTVIDDREEYSNAHRFPEARHTIAGEFSAVVDQLVFSGTEYVVIVTRGHKHDTLVLEQVLKQSTRYVGMIGSRRKTRMVLDHLKDKGIDDELTARVFAPIGLDIGAETPEEIAVSIVAELINVRRRPESRQSLSMQQVVNYGAPRQHSRDHHKVLFG